MFRLFKTLEDNLRHARTHADCNSGPLRKIIGTGLVEETKLWYFMHLLECGHMVKRSCILNRTGWIRPPGEKNHCGYCYEEELARQPTLL